MTAGGRGEEGLVAAVHWAMQSYEEGGEASHLAVFKAFFLLILAQ